MGGNPENAGRTINPSQAGRIGLTPTQPRTQGQWNPPQQQQQFGGFAQQQWQPAPMNVPQYAGFAQQQLPQPQFAGYGQQMPIQQQQFYQPQVPYQGNMGQGSFM
jgi:hypothetical protein